MKHKLVNGFSSVCFSLLILFYAIWYVEHSRIVGIDRENSVVAYRISSMGIEID